MTKNERKEMAQKLNREFLTEPELLPEKSSMQLGAFSTDGDEEVYNEHQYDRYDVTNLFSGVWNISIKGRAVKAKGKTKLSGRKIKGGYVLSPVVYEQTACFRYAPPN
ncbi:MAG: hypothetical protein CSYNP_01216 [Syntrophus sp. SKADARSKE-3]|nr:hypothetical protein [Syntrophus sp. SKADARSKE-3]